jgi:aminoglycoside phosphotransferase (APT) family kinase protein
LQPSDVQRAAAAAMSVASALGLAADDAIVLQNSNNLAVRLAPCDVFARVAPRGREKARFELELAQRLAETGCPTATLEPRVAPRPYEHDGFVVTLWTYYATATPPDVAPADYASALARLHAGLRNVDVATPHFWDRVAEAERLIASRDLTPALADADRALLGGTLADLRRAIAGRGAAEQLLHGEPHPGNLLGAKDGPVFIDLETCCRGPIEFDLAHAPEAVALHYPGVDPDLLGECRRLILAMVAAWRWDATDQFPNGRRVGQALVSALRSGPPWPSLDAMMRGLADP